MTKSRIKSFECFCGKFIPETSFNHYQGKDKIRLEVCQKLPFYESVDGNDYCLLHSPNNDKSTDFELIIKERLDNKEYNFGGIWFPRKADFRERKFEKIGIANFDQAHFSNKADFWFAEFPEKVFFDFTEFESEAVFSFAKFGVASFQDVKFLGDAVFYNTRFEFGNFNSAKFKKDVNFVFSKLKNGFFSEADFSSDEKTNATFYDAEFLEMATFDQAVFPETVDFRKVIFGDDVLFTGSHFQKTYFESTEFQKDVYFNYSTFQERIFFENVKFFGNVDFSKTKVLDQMQFLGETINKVFSKEHTLGLEHCFIEKPERILFHTVNLNIRWFVNVDSSKFVFTDIYWTESFQNPKLQLRSDLKTIEYENSKQLYKIACRQLADNAENNNRFEEASKFRQMALETEWLEKKEKISNWIKNLVPESEKLKRRFGGSTNEEDKPIPPTNSFGILRRSGDFLIHGLYRITSFYGESWSWALGVLFCLIFAIFPIIFTQLDFQVSPKSIPLEVVVKDCKDVEEELKPVCKIERRNLSFDEAILHSLSSATFQEVEYRKPISFWAELWTILEKIFAPLQVALLALAIRRKFMR